MAKAEILGHIDCPTCGTSGGMRITADKNGEPFGFCEAECNQQMRVGGSPRRVALFVARYPWAGKNPVTVTEATPAAKPEPEARPAAKPAAKPEPEAKPAAKPAPEAKPARGGFAFGL